ncbi:CdaR family transcriptional regulator [Pseudalkalibacillus caeni]|uniref:Transcriptional regulator n=1 Tax=Exobacillus caeni TaxID=2574798 RepID=A0A5R9F846_9BACL|nr:sugar diacid recognition domain-containing protein [Pseudalkalibacillus caeni]TLS38420.1 hypothetical protein FCL54_04580 [Pseudalkalibacillus caeni]
MLTRQIANVIVKETSIRLNRNVNIMNDKGVIIASRDASRIDHIHEGAVEVLRTGETLKISPTDDGKWRGSQPGLNLPISFQNRIVGVIGITGNPDEMEDLGGLVRMTTELMIKQEYIASQMEWKQRTKEMIIEELLKPSPSYEAINRGLSLIELTLNPPFLTLIIQMKERAIPNHTLIQKIEQIIGQGNGIVGFININRLFVMLNGLTESQTIKRVERIYYELKKIKLTFQLSFSTPFDSIEECNQSYKDCDLAFEISNSSQEIISFADIEAKALIYQISHPGAKRFSQRIMNDSLSSYVDTLEAFFENNLNIQQTSDALFIHRNTLIYRLNKVKEETGYDPRYFKDALTLRIAIWISKKKAGKTNYYG